MAESNPSERWPRQKDWDDHLPSDIIAVLLGAGSLMRWPPEIVIHTVSRSSGLEA